MAGAGRYEQRGAARQRCRLCAPQTQHAHAESAYCKMQCAYQVVQKAPRAGRPSRAASVRGCPYTRIVRRVGRDKPVSAAPPPPPDLPFGGHCLVPQPQESGGRRGGTSSAAEQRSSGRRPFDAPLAQSQPWKGKLAGEQQPPPPAATSANADAACAGGVGIRRMMRGNACTNPCTGAVPLARMHGAMNAGTVCTDHCPRTPGAPPPRSARRRGPASPIGCGVGVSGAFAVQSSGSPGGCWRVATCAFGLASRVLTPPPPACASTNKACWQNRLPDAHGLMRALLAEHDTHALAEAVNPRQNNRTCAMSMPCLLIARKQPLERPSRTRGELVLTRDRERASLTPVANTPVVPPVGISQKCWAM
eukprot:366564-Chlamydomonas_euryale.AAC.15